MTYTYECEHRAGIVDPACGAPATWRVDRGWKYRGERPFYFCDQHTEDARKWRRSKWTYNRIERTG